MMVLLPPSETKAPGGGGPPVDPAALAFPALAPVRERLLDALVGLAGDPAASRVALGPAGTGESDLAANAALRRAPTAPALERYTGVLYAALDVATLPPVARARADHAVVVASALFGAVRGGDLVPAYRLSAGSRLPGLGTLAALWRPALVGVLDAAVAAADGPVLDLRSGAYAALWRPGREAAERLVGVRVLAEAPDGSRTVVSHASGAAKGRLAGGLLPAAEHQPAGRVTGRAEAVHRLVAAAATTGLRAEPTAAGVDLVEPRRPPLRTTTRRAPATPAGRAGQVGG